VRAPQDKAWALHHAFDRIIGAVRAAIDLADGNE
jgi:hypothetical protein